MLSHFKNEKKLNVLDIGTGPGFFPFILSEKGHIVTGIDSSESMIKAALKNTAHLIPKPKFLLMDVKDLNFDAASFDVVTMRNVMWALDNPEMVYQEIYRILRPNGKLLVYDANWNMQFFDEELLKRVHQHEDEYYEETDIRMQVRVDDIIGSDSEKSVVIEVDEDGSFKTMKISENTYALTRCNHNNWVQVTIPAFKGRQRANSSTTCYYNVYEAKYRCANKRCSAIRYIETRFPVKHTFKNGKCTVCGRKKK